MMNTKGIQRNSLKALPHPYLRGAWSVAGRDEQGRTLHVRDVAGGVCHWHTRQQAITAAATLNADPTPRA